MGKNNAGNRKVVLVTGASSGFGRSIASLLSQNGYRVFGTSRSPKGAGHNGFELIELDVTSDRSVKSCIDALIRKAGRIDILVNNAGYVSSGSLEESSMDEAKAQFETNFFGAVRMVNAVLPIMRKQRGGQIINMSSMADTLAAPFQGYYAPTKAALTSYTESLRLEVKGFGIKVSAIEPGIFNTNLFKIQKTTARQMPEYKKLKHRSLSVLANQTANGGNPGTVAQMVLKVIECDKPKIRYPVGKERPILRAKKLIPEKVFESILRKHFKLDE